MDNLIAFSLSVLTLLAVPGPTNTLLAASGATVGVRRSLHLLLGELAAYNITVLAVRELVDVFGHSSGAETAFRAAVAVYLVFLAIRLWRDAPAPNVRSVDIRRIFLTTLLNPKGLVFALVLFPAQAVNPVPYFAVFSVLVPIIGATWIFAGSVATNVAGERYVIWVPRIASVALAVFATVLVVGIAR